MARSVRKVTSELNERKDFLLFFLLILPILDLLLHLLSRSDGLRVDWQHGQQPGSRAVRGELKVSSQLAEPFSHAANPNPSAARMAEGALLLQSNSFAGIFDFES